MRLEIELPRHRVGDHGAAAGADVLGGDARDQAMIFDRKLDLRARLPEIEPVAGGDTNAVAVAAGLRSARFCVFPRVELQGPIIEALPVRVRIPFLAQKKRIDVET